MTRNLNGLRTRSLRVPALLRRPTLQLLLVAALVAAVYLPALGRYFVSEDFTILRQLLTGDFWPIVWAQVSGSWLGLELVTFYRPISTLLLLLETRLWGTWSTGYLLTHLGVHLLNVVLVYRLASTLSREDRVRPVLATLTALLFALYPFQLNAVAFIASYAALFATTSSLLTLLLLHRGYTTGGPLWSAWAGLAVALGCYEGAAVLPLLALALDGLCWRRPDGVGSRRLISRHGPLFLLLAAYLALRSSLLGFVVGGYLGTDLLVSQGRWSELFERSLLAWGRFLLPLYDARSPARIEGLVAVGVATLALISLRFLRRGRERTRRAAKLWLVGVGWVFVSQLPFQLVQPAPAEGRVWYQAAVGIGPLLVAGARLLTGRHWIRVASGTGLVLAALYLVELDRGVELHAEAGRQSREIQAALTSAQKDGGRLFVDRHPRFVHGNDGQPVAQVFHWGLADACLPPFAAAEIEVYPLPQLAPASLAPLLERTDLGRAVEWNRGSLRDIVAPTDALASGRLLLTRLPRASGINEDLRLGFLTSGATSYRIVTLSQGHPAIETLATGGVAGERVEAELDLRFVRSMERLYDGPIFWWIEAIDEEGRPQAFSDLHPLPPG